MNNGLLLSHPRNGNGADIRISVLVYLISENSYLPESDQMPVGDLVTYPITYPTGFPEPNG